MGSSQDLPSSNLGQKTLEALKCLRPSGEESFEKLTAILLSQLVGVPIWLCKAGYQAGIDALAEIPFAIEDKRYQEDRLDQTELLGKLADAVLTHPDLQLWVLASTAALDALCREKLAQAAETHGVGILILVQQLYEQDQPRFDQWLAWLLADKARARNWWGGLLMPIFQVMLHVGDKRAKELWELVSPFRRERTTVGARFVIDGIHWGFHELSKKNVNDDLATALLRDLVHQALSDRELFYIALGARRQGQDRLSGIITELLGHSDAEMRARAVKIAGWLEDMAQTISIVESTDSSLWVRKIASDALMSQRHEAWAQHWFRLFLTGATVETRWGAGQLFLACADARFHVWAWPTIDRLNLTNRVRGEAILLLQEAQKVAEKCEQQLQDYFLQHKINDLKAVCEPWHPTVEWEQLGQA